MFIDLRERETWIDWPLVHTPTRDRTHNLGMCPDQGLNPQSFGVRDTEGSSKISLDFYQLWA